MAANVDWVLETREPENGHKCARCWRTEYGYEGQWVAKAFTPKSHILRDEGTTRCGLTVTNLGPWPGR